MEMIKNSPRDCYPTVQKTTLIILERLNHILAVGDVQQRYDRAEMINLQGLLCATLQVRDLCYVIKFTILSNVLNEF